ncbi:MAG TPA: LptF/LptG family permease [Phycisphaerae bacterium]|nr:LptF/LptG family permease [Phycisphaerae bacterium]
MVWTLQRYIFRELLKTFALSTVALILLFTSGMGLLKSFNVEDFSPGDMVKLFIFLVPLCASFMMPISALFSAAVTYGRLASDNEFDACKASGINVHRLLLPAGVLAGLVSLCTFSFSNYVVPHLTGQLDKMIEPALPQIFARELAHRGYITVRNRYAIYADQVDQVSAAEQTPSGQEQLRHYVVLNRAAFIQYEGQEPSLFGTAATATVEFRSVGGEHKIEAGLHNVRVFDWKRSTFIEEDYRPVERTGITIPIKQKPKFWNLKELLRYRRHPAEAPGVINRIELLRMELASFLYFRSLADSLREPGGQVELSSEQRRYTVAAQEVSISEEDGSLKLRGPVVVDAQPNKTRHLTAKEATLRGQWMPYRDTIKFSLQMSLRGDVQIEDPEAKAIGGNLSKPSEDLRPLPLPPSILDATRRYSNAELIDRDVELPLSGGPARGRTGLCADVFKLVYKIDGILHMRLAYSLCALVLVVLGAALGVIVRGGQVLTAFGVSFIPAMFVIVAIIMGRQLAENTNTASIGVAIIWGSLLVTAALNPAITWRFMRR